MSGKQRTTPVTASKIVDKSGEGLPVAGLLGERLRRLRRSRDMTLGELAERAGCTKSYLSAIECGKKGPPSESVIAHLERALSCEPGELQTLANWDRTPDVVRDDIRDLRQRDQHARLLARLLTSSAQRGTSLDELYDSGLLRQVIDRVDPGSGDRAGSSEQAVALPAQVPVINKVPAGYPAGFTDMGYPARVADEYIRTPDLNDPDAFAARVVGDSMQPNYQEGDIVVFSPAKVVQSGADCFVRLEPDSESTFKRVYFETDEAGNELIRIQPINNAYAPRTVPREQVAGLYAGVSVIRSIG